MFEIGPSLREARTQRGLSPQDVQKAIRIRDRYLGAIEDEQWSLLPGDAYAKGFLRTYAEFLGLDGNLYVDEYNSQVAGRPDPAFVPEALPRAGPPPVGILRPVLAVGAIVAAVAAVAAWQLHGSGSPAPRTAATATTPPATTAAASAPAKKPRTTTTATTQTPKRAVLAATDGPVWLLVRSGGSTGAIVYEGTLEPGATLPVRLSPEVWVRIGAPWNLQVRMGGRVVSGLPAHAGNVILNANGLAPAA